jgi:hypothetical protein
VSYYTTVSRRLIREIQLSTLRSLKLDMVATAVFGVAAQASCGGEDSARRSEFAAGGSGCHDYQGAVLRKESSLRKGSQLTGARHSLRVSSRRRAE